MIARVARRVWELRPGVSHMAVMAVLSAGAWWVAGVPPLLAAAGLCAAVGVVLVATALAEIRREDAPVDDPPPEEP